MTRKTPAKKAKAARKPKPLKAYIAVRKIESVNRSYTEPDRVFGSKKAAQEHAERLNRELRACANPFTNERVPDFLVPSEKTFFKLLKKLEITVPKPPKGGYVEWEQWWAGSELTEAQRDALWDAFKYFEWYTVRETTLED